MPAKRAEGAGFRLAPSGHRNGRPERPAHDWTYRGTGHDMTGMGCTCDDKHCPGSSQPRGSQPPGLNRGNTATLKQNQPKAGTDD